MTLNCVYAPIREALPLVNSNFAGNWGRDPKNISDLYILHEWRLKKHVSKSILIDIMKMGKNIVLRDGQRDTALSTQLVILIKNIYTHGVGNAFFCLLHTIAQKY